LENNSCEYAVLNQKVIDSIKYRFFMKVIKSKIFGCIICVSLCLETNAQVIEKLRINPGNAYGGNASE